MVSSTDQEIISVINSLKKAKENLARIQEEYSSEPDLLNFYSYSAKEMIKTLENHLEYLLKKELGSNFSINDPIDDLDLWIRIEGESFQYGKGPINVIGSYLQKLNTAVRHSTGLIKNKFDEINGLNFNNFFPSFELAATAKGSLKLGLQNNITDMINSKEFLHPNLFDQNSTYEEFLLSKLKSIDKINEIINQGIEVLFKALASADDATFIKELTQEFDEDDVIKLIHYAQELAPSSRSSIDSISFEGERLKHFKNIRTDKSTRGILKERAQHLRYNKEFVEGTGLIRQYSVDSDKSYYSLIARPFKYNNRTIDEVELRVKKSKLELTEDQVFNQLIFISGFLHYNANNQPTFIDLDSIDYEKIEELYGE